MPLTVPSPDNDFLVVNETRLDPPTLTAVFQALWFRIKDLQEIAAGFEDAVSQSAIELADGKLNLSVAPALNTLNDRVAEITALMADAEDRLAALQNGGVAAENVPIGPIEGFPANTNAAEAFSMLSAFAAQTETALQTIGETAGAAQPKAEKNQPNGYAGIGANGRVPAEFLSGTSRIVFEAFVSSGTFTKEDADLGYLVVIIDGGGGGSQQPAAQPGLAGRVRSFFCLADTLPQSVPVVVGAGALGRVRVAGLPTVGGASSFGTATTSGVPDEGGVTASGGPTSAYNAPGNPGGLPNTPARTGTAAAGGALGGKGADALVPGGGGGSGGGGDSGTGYNAGSGGNGAAPGGGGGAGGISGNSASQNGNGGNGARGEVRIYRFKKQ